MTLPRSSVSLPEAERIQTFRMPVPALSMKELQQMLWQMKQMQQMQIYQPEVQVHQQEVRQEVRICINGT